MSSNHDLATEAAFVLLARYSVGNVLPKDFEGAVKIIADTYAAPTAELERLRQQVAFVKRESLLAIRDIRGKHVETRCGLCKNAWHPLGEPYHADDCPHNEVAK